MSELIRLLLVEDSIYDAELLIRGLVKAGFDVVMERVQTSQEMQAALAAREWDAIISDYNLPVFSAPKALEILRKSGNDLPFIVVSGEIGEETAVEIMRSGAHDYLMKSNLNRLAEALRREIREARGRADSRAAGIALKQSEEQLRLLFERSNDAIFVVDKNTGQYLNANKAAEKLTGRTLEEIKTLTFMDISSGGTEDRLNRLAGIKAATDYREIVYQQPGGNTRIATLTVLPIDDSLVFGIAHDITEQVLAEKALRRRAQELEVLYRSSLEINTQTELLPMLEKIVKSSANMLGAHISGLYLMRSESDLLELVVGYNMPGHLIGTTLKPGEGLSGLIAQTGETMMIDDYQAWENRAAVYENASFRRVLGIPLRIKGSVIGVFTILDDEKTGPYSTEEIRLASLFAEQAAIAVENARLLNAVQRELHERRQTELALRESEERYRIVVTMAPLISFVFDARGLFTLSEGKGLAALGLRPGQVLGKSVFDLYKDVPEIIEDVSRALAGEYRNRDTKVGENIFDIHYIPAYDEEGKVIHVIGLAIDISERKRAEESLRQSEASYRGLFDSVEEAIYIQSGDGCFLDVNKGAVNMYGYPREYFIGKTPEILGAPGRNDMQSVLNSAGKAFKGEPQAFEFWGLRANGEVFPKEVRLYPGTYFGQDVIIALSVDITERKKAEENLRSMQAFLDHVLKAVPLGINVYDLETSNMEFDNAATRSINGMGILEFNALQPEERSNILHVDERESIANFMENLVTISEGEVREIEFRRKNPNGNWHWFHYRYFLFEHNGEGKVTKLLSVSEDITARKQSEQALQRQLEELSSLHNIARSGIQLNSVDELVELVTQEVGNSFYPDNFGVLLLDETQKILRAHPSYRGIGANIAPIASLDKSISGSVVTSGKPRRIKDVLLEPNYLQVTTNIRSELCVPITTDERTIGVINAESRQLDFFSDDDERLLLTIAGQMAIAIERIRLFNLERKRRQEAETLRQATAALSTSLDLDHVLESILTSLKQVVPYDSASVFLLEGDHLRITIANGIKDAGQIIDRNYPANDPLFLEVKERREPLILANAQDDPRFMKWGETSYVLGWMAVPLITRGEVIGYITLDSRTQAAYSLESAGMAQAFGHQAAAAIENARLFEGIDRSLRELNQAYDSTIEGWSRAMDLRDKETEGHTQRVTDMTTRLAQVMGIRGEQLIHIRRGALLHDIGKMGVPDRILLKPDSLSDDEAIVMRRHPSYAFDMLAPIDYLHPALDIPYCHHERWDGTGYPRGLKGEQIPLAARLFAVVDVWDALTSDRPYRPSWTSSEAQKYIQELSGIQFDPQIVEKFIGLLSAQIF